MQDQAPGKQAIETFRATYFEECAELLDALYQHISTLEQGQGDPETVHAIFRCVHSIKGGGGAFGFDRLVAFAHVFEALLDKLRDGKILPEREMLQLMLRASDMLADLVAGARLAEGPAAGAEDSLRALLAGMMGDSKPETSLVPDAEAASAPVSTARRWRIRFVPHAAVYASANEPLLIFRELARLGNLIVHTDLSRLPDLAVFEPTEAYLFWTLDLETAEPRERIEEAFEFVADDSDILIESVNHEEPGSAAAPMPAAATPASEARADPGPGVAEPGRETRSIRVDVEKVDRLVNLVGELVITQAMLVQFGGSLPPETCPGLTGGLETLSQHLRELQEGVMAIRAQPVRSVFSRMPRLVREVSAQLGKTVRLAVTGEGTEIDKTVIEQLADPLTHLLRNALDHGIEPPHEREARNKPKQGAIHLSAEHRSGRIVIEVSDDGRGIDRPKVLAKARQNGLVPVEAILSSDEIDDLIFRPGLTTADEVSAISGRGVGMDVVRRNIQSLGGRIAVSSSPGVGCRFTLSLPLTLAILDGMSVAVGQETYIIPLTNIMESLRPVPRDLHPVVGRGHVLSIRGEYVPLLFLHEVFGVSGAETDACCGIVVVVESDRTGRFGIVVDEMLGQQQVVVKSLEANYGSVDGIGGATILGNGRVALILDVARLQGVANGAAARSAVPFAPAPGRQILPAAPIH